MEADSQNGVSHVQQHPEFLFPRRFFFEPRFGSMDATSNDFATLLWVWYSPKYRLDRRSSDNWLAILELSTRWQFLEMRKLAIEQLQNLKMDPVEKIAIYNKYDIDRSLLLPEYKHLCTREGQMSIEEGEKVGLLTVLAIHQARERAMTSAVANERRGLTHADVDDEELEQILRDIFNLNEDSTTRSQLGADIASRITDRSSGPGSSSQREDATGMVCRMQLTKCN
ncbi:hypothetical protein DFJ58DRAFT_854871 [Suillus subalutaceus]|uniref:uncharacterized protein n=1 Tax=Suillus subalutaceus TaxID=48586 RepID=UPI001B88522F|nr:uncharacterized protein DFJ58DRAFT_854871 [Suillus subalutaceus]KAG1842887.1 hypothetical protein DFJ58DRAFT_854871 [Suillus subalutaceus]